MLGTIGKHVPRTGLGEMIFYAHTLTLHSVAALLIHTSLPSSLLSRARGENADMFWSPSWKPDWRIQREMRFLVLRFIGPLWIQTVEQK